MGNIVPNEFKSIKSLERMPDNYFVNGRKVRVINNKSYVKYIQSSNGGWDENMNECINQCCTVIKVDFDKAIHVSSSHNKKWLFNRAALEPLDAKDFNSIAWSIPSNASTSLLQNKLTMNTPQSKSMCELPSCVTQRSSAKSSKQNSPDVKHNKQPEKKPSNSSLKEFKVGDILRVSSNESLIKEKQQFCGGYSKMRMRDLIGKLVHVKHFSTKCVKVEKEGRDYDLHPDILDYPKTLVKSKPEDINVKPEDSNDSHSKLFTAIKTGDIDKIYELIDKTILNIKDNNNRTPVNLACCLGEKAIVELLIDFGADLSYPDNLGFLPIHNCAINGHDEILKLLLQKYPDNLNRKTQNGQSLLNIAIQKKNKDLETFLMDKNCTNSESSEYYRPFPGNSDEIRPNFENSLAFSLLYPPTTLHVPEISTEENFSRSLKYPSTKIDSLLREPPRDDSLFNNSQLLDVFDTIRVPSVSNIRPSMVDPPHQLIDNPVSIENECTICRDGFMNIAFVKCGHVACRRCADRIFRCHICNAEIEDKMNIYL